MLILEYSWTMKTYVAFPGAEGFHVTACPDCSFVGARPIVNPPGFGDAAPPIANIDRRFVFVVLIGVRRAQKAIRGPGENYVAVRLWIPRRPE